MTDEPEEQARIESGERLEADLVDDEQRDVHVLLGPQSPGREILVALEHQEQILEPEEGDREAVLDGVDDERHAEMRLADAGWPLQQQRLPFTDPCAGGQRPAQRCADPTLLTLSGLMSQELIEEAVSRDVLLHRLVQQFAQVQRRMGQPTCSSASRVRSTTTRP